MIQPTSRIFLFSIYYLMVTSCSDAVETANESKIDARPPTTTATAIADLGTDIYKSKNTPITISGSKSPIIISLNCSDDKSGCDSSKLFYNIDSNLPFSVYDPIDKITITKTSTIKFYSIDYAQNVERINSQTYIIDYAPRIENGTLAFTISDTVWGVEWEAAIDPHPNPASIVPQPELTYQLYSHIDEKSLATVQSVFSNNVTAQLKDWQTSNKANINVDLNNATDLFWQVLVRDAFGNYSSYKATKFSPDKVVIPSVSITSIFTTELSLVSKLDGGSLMAYIVIDNDERIPMDIFSNKASTVLRNFKPSKHSFSIVYEYVLNKSSDNPVVIAQASLDQDFSNGLSAFEIQENSLTSVIDSDGDGISNINEIFAQTNSNSKWTWVAGSEFFNSAGNYINSDTTLTKLAPGARYESISWIDNYNHLWLFGGNGVDAGGSWGTLNDLWRWDGEKWTWISGSKFVYKTGVYSGQSIFPGSRYGSISWIDKDGKLCLFGGRGIDANGAHGYLNDLWCWDCTKWDWISGSKIKIGTTVNNQNNYPTARIGAVSWTDDKNQIWLFGGLRFNLNLSVDRYDAA